jgi:hypothetical protein
VQQGAAKIGSIVSLGDKCDSCVIMQICGSCHDDVNDPGFEFEVLDKIEAQRHGTIEPGTGKAKAESAAIPNSTDVALSTPEIRHAFDRLDGRGSAWTPH